MPKDLAVDRRRHQDAAPLHEEIPYWGWLPDRRTCLTVGGELVTLAAMETYESSGRPGEYLDYVLERWVRLLSTAGSRTRVYLYLLRRPATDFPTGVAWAGPRAELARLALEGRRRFLEPRLQTLDVVVAWSRDARLKQRREKATALARAKQVFGPTAAVSSWALAEIEREAREMADTVDAAAGLVSDLTPLEILEPERASRFLSELVNAPDGPAASASEPVRRCRGRWLCRRSRRSDPTSASTVRPCPCTRCSPRPQRRGPTNWRTSCSCRRGRWN